MSPAMQSFLKALRELMENHRVTRFSIGYGAGTDTHGIHDEHIEIECTGESCRTPKYDPELSRSTIDEMLKGE